MGKRRKRLTMPKYANKYATLRANVFGTQAEQEIAAEQIETTPAPVVAEEEKVEIVAEKAKEALATKATVKAAKPRRTTTRKKATTTAKKSTTTTRKSATRKKATAKE